ncbi:hypothetical protein BGZ99_006127 [Dissophora globulifera]|uniref:Pre-mRNA-splicing factor CWC26 n=1 Tax=Dissophora globulifera TaxID=979702 RepID=A0A9P6RH92_9FUNG|nr:hypothetical protein BGZ99_006127 [Dissophora globulifera]
MSSTQDYLKKYMSKPSSVEEQKKRRLKKKKTTTKSTLKKGNFAIHDEDEISWKNAASESEDEEDKFQVVEQPKAPQYKSNSSSWATIRQGESEPSRESILQRNVVPEWDDVENEDERPAIAGVVVETESTHRLKNPKPKKTWKETPHQATIRQREHSPEPASHHDDDRRSPSPRGRSPEALQRTGDYRPRSRSGSPVHNKRRRSPSRSLSPQRRPRSIERLSSGAAAGLQTAEQVKRDMDRIKQRHLDRMNQLDPSTSGRDAETVYRDAQGRKIDRVQEKIDKAEAARREIEKQERLMEWGKGLVQREAEIEKKRREEEEKLKPLARYKDDQDLNEELKERERWNDPAAMFLSGTKKSKKAVRKYPLYQGDFQPNRFNIRPGYRWDGHDRSNGFEKSYFERVNMRKHQAEEAHMWSVEDM